MMHFMHRNTIVNVQQAEFVRNYKNIKFNLFMANVLIWSEEWKVVCDLIYTI